MARLKVRFLVVKRGAQGGLPRYFWDPSAPFKAAGWRPRRIPEDWPRHADAAALDAAAIAAARALDLELDAWCTGARDARVGVAAGGAGANQKLPAPQHTLGALIDLYRGVDKARPASDEWQKLRPSTRRGYDQALARIRAWGADTPLAGIDAADVKNLLRPMARTPAFRNAVGRMLRVLFQFGIGEGWLRHNPARDVALPEPAPSGMIWPREAVAHFVAAADALGRPSIGTAVLLNEWLGQRQGDILRMPVSAYRGGALVLRQSKTGAAVTLPVDIVAHLSARLAAELARRATVPAPQTRGAVRAAKSRGNVAVATILVCEATGLPWRADFFRAEFARIRAAAAAGIVDAAGRAVLAGRQRFEIDYLLPGRDMADPDAFRVRMTDLTFMALRHTAITRNAEAEIDDSGIASVSGHSLVSIAQIKKRYHVRTRIQALRAFEKRARAEGLLPPATAPVQEEKA